MPLDDLRRDSDPASWLAEYLRALKDELKHHGNDIAECRKSNSEIKQSVSGCEAALAAINERLKHVPTKNDLTKISVAKKDPIARLGGATGVLGFVIFLIGKSQGWW